MDAKIQAKMKAKMNKIRFSKSDKVYYTIDMCILVFLTLLVLYPLYFVVIPPRWTGLKRRRTSMPTG